MDGNERRNGRTVLIEVVLGALISLSLLVLLSFKSPVFAKLSVAELLLCWAVVLLGPLGGALATVIVFVRTLSFEGAPLLLLALCTWTMTSFLLALGILAPSLPNRSAVTARIFSRTCHALWYLIGFVFLGSGIT